MPKARAASFLGLIALALAAPACADELIVMSTPIASFKGASLGEPVDGLVWRGGLVMHSDAPEFGGLSGIAFTGPDQRLATVSDAGHFISGRLIYDEAGTPLEFIGVEATAILNSKGNVLPRAYTRDAESIDTIYRQGQPAAVRVSFENLTRVADFDLADSRPSGAARQVNIPDWLSELRTNRSLEALCIAPDASPIAGSTLLITEGADAGNGDFAAFMLGNRDRGDFSIQRAAGLNPTDCAFLPDGDLLVLERGTGLLSFVMQIRRIDADQVQPGRALSGEVILTASGGDIDNMEGLAVHTGPDGETRITVVSDDNFNDWERTLLLEFALPGQSE